MGFLVRKSNKTIFRLIQEIWTPERKSVVVPREAYAALGFRHDMTLDEAKARAKQINKQDQLESRKIAAAAKRIADVKEINFAYLPEALTVSFEEELTETYADNPGRLTTVSKHWSTIKKMISELALDPKDYYAERQKFFNYFKKQSWSPDYIKKLTRLINLWGHFYSRRTNSFYQPIPKLSGVQINKIVELRDGKPGIKTAADPLAWSDLKKVKSSFEHDNLVLHWNWLFIGLWFGLRPKEIDGLTNSKNWKIETDARSKTKVLMVYQSKLTGVAKDKRWKPIPICLPEQKEALKLIETKEFKRPLNKTLRRFFETKIETYSPRKGFTDLMLEKGFSLEDISVFLGHADISMTWKHYKNKMTFKLPDKINSKAG